MFTWVSFIINSYYTIIKKIVVKKDKRIISTYVNTNLSVDPFDAIFDPTENPVFQNKAWDGWPIKCG